MRSSELLQGAKAHDRGFVTAEAAVAVPSLVVFTMALVWALMAASAQIQCVDAARAGARAAARSEPRAAALAAARSAAPNGAEVTLDRTGGLWRVRVEAETPGPGALSLTLSADAAAAAEDTTGQEPGSAGYRAPRAENRVGVRPVLVRADRAGRAGVTGVAERGVGAAIRVLPGDGPPAAPVDVEGMVP
ncbi:TadE family type IV pilus minor pilin [Streptomyces sp. NPDC006283]|uniref:TadE family type IV pilus minor pilin n=1 Tax=Streptomyces sp. NPDC006283 TaxID=3156741 RepID=UPI0033AAF42E